MIGISMDKIFVTGAVELNKKLNFEMKAEINEHAILELDGMVNRVSDESFSELIGEKIFLNCDLEGVNFPIFAGTIQE